MRLISPVTHSVAVEILTSKFGFRVVRAEGLQTEMRRGSLHVVVRTYGESGGTVIRFHEDRFRMGERHTVETNARLERFGAELKEALLERRQAERGAEGVVEVEAPGLLERCRFYNECGEAREERLCCRSSIYSTLCEEYRRLMRKKGG